MSVLKNILKGEAKPIVVRPEAVATFNGELLVVSRERLELLERQLVMERLRTKELREQLVEMDSRITVLQEAGDCDLVEDYERLAVDDVIPWVERVLLPAYGLLVARMKGGAL